MAEIHVLPANIDIAGAAKLMAALSRAVESGTDLGSRGPHIRALGHTLERQIAPLQEELAHLMADPVFAGASEQDLLAHVQQLVSTMERLTILAQAYQP